MAISPVNLTRVSQGLRTDMMLESLRRNQRDLFQTQSRIAAGRNFLTASENPVGAARVLDLSHALTRQSRFAANARHADNFLAAADSSLSEISSLLIEASTIASQTVSNLTSEAEREAEAEVVASIRRQLEIVGNRQFDGRFLFGGRETTAPPFVDALGGVAYVGDGGDLLTRLSQTLFGVTNVTGTTLYRALSEPITSDADLTPILTGSVRLEDVTGAAGRPIEATNLVINEPDGAGVYTVDLSDADTLGDVVDSVNAAASDAGSSLTATLTATGMSIDTGGQSVTITDSGGRTASDLGIDTPTPTGGTITGETLTPRITRLTPIADLAEGAGIDLEGGLLIDNGGNLATVDVSEAETVQDLINAINNAGVFVLARINEAGTGIDVLNQVSGTSLSIGENGGTTATDLGIRNFDTATPLSGVNFGNGVHTVEGEADLQIVARDGATVDVNLDGATTVGEVIERINDDAATAGVSVSASFTTTGNGIRVEDTTGGTGDLSVRTANLSTAAIDLGLQKTVSDSELIGDDVNRRRTDGILDSLIQLENALRADDTQGISAAGNRLDGHRAEVIRIHGQVGARSQAATAQREQLEDAALATEVFLSEVQDLDYADGITRMQQAMVRLQANLQTGPQVMNLSLLDFLR